MAQSHPRRLIWIVNHRTLLPAEIPIFLELGYEVFIPKVVPDDPDMRSMLVTYEYDHTLSLPPDVLEALNRHSFYTDAWPPELTALLNEHFDVVVAAITWYITPMVEAARHFDGTIVGRVFGREDPRSFTEFF